MNEEERKVVDEKFIQMLPKISNGFENNNIPKGILNKVLNDTMPELAENYLTDQEKFELELKKGIHEEYVKQEPKDGEELQTDGLEW